MGDILLVAAGAFLGIFLAEFTIGRRWFRKLDRRIRALEKPKVQWASIEEETP